MKMRDRERESRIIREQQPKQQENENLVGGLIKTDGIVRIEGDVWCVCMCMCDFKVNRCV